MAAVAALLALATVAATYIGFAIAPPSQPPSGSEPGQSLPWTSEGVAYWFWTPGLASAALLYATAIARAAPGRWRDEWTGFGAGALACVALLALAVVGVHSDVVVIHVVAVQVFASASVLAFVSIWWRNRRAGAALLPLTVVLALLAAVLVALTPTLAAGFGDTYFLVSRLAANTRVRILEGPLVGGLAVGWLIVAPYFRGASTSR